MARKKSPIVSYLVPLSAVFVFLVLCGLGFYRFYNRVSTVTSDIVVEHVEELADIFDRIDKTAQIIDFEHEKNYVDFLTVKEFVGSEIGAMNLAKPDGWQGPYVKDNPTMQEKYYVVIKSDQGYYLAPGDGVKLSNGKVIGQDIVLNRATDFETLTMDPDGLMHNGKPIARKIK